MINGVVETSLELLWQLLQQGDFIGFLTALYTSLLGDLFYGIVLLALALPLYIRTQSLTYVAIMWIILMGVFTVILPAEAYRIVRILFVLGVASAILSLFARWAR